MRAEVSDVGQGDEAGIAAAGSRLRGRWLLVHRDPTISIDDLDGEYSATPPLYAAAHAQGALGVLWMSTHPGRYVRNAKAGNVVAEIRGREQVADTIILGAHLDSWDLGRGALDDGCNAALTIDVARQMMRRATQGERPRRTVRFVLFTGEEDGFWGSWADVRQHRAELDRVKAMIELDLGSGRITGFSLGGREDLRGPVDHALLPAAALGPFSHTTDAFIGSDNYDYLLEGVPTLVANQDAVPYLPHYHAESDTFDKVDAMQLKANTAIVAALVWDLADMAGVPGPRQSRAEVEELARKTGLEKQMRTFGLWEDFASGARGRALQ